MSWVYGDLWKVDQAVSRASSFGLVFIEALLHKY